MNNNFLLDSEEVVFYITKHFDSSDYLRDILLNIIKSKWEESLYYFFSLIYDELYYDILTKKISLSLETRRILELLAIPIYKKSNNEKEKLYKKISINSFNNIKNIVIKENTISSLLL